MLLIQFETLHTCTIRQIICWYSHGTTTKVTEVKLHYFWGRAYGCSTALAVKKFSSILNKFGNSKLFELYVLDFLLPLPWYYHGHGSSVILLPSLWYYHGSTSRWFGGLYFSIFWKNYSKFFVFCSIVCIYKNCRKF